MTDEGTRTRWAMETELAQLKIDLAWTQKELEALRRETEVGNLKELLADRTRLEFLALGQYSVRRAGNYFWVYDPIGGHGKSGFRNTWRAAVDHAMDRNDGLEEEV
jgi:hypothetical protein